jgi:HEAT repeat protein
VQTDANPRVREAAAHALQPYADDPEVREILLDRVRHDPDALVVTEAAVALVAAGIDDEHRDLLALRATGDDDSVRAAALRALGESFGADPAIRELLIEAVRRDPDLPVRREALRVLGERLYAHEEVRQVLVDMVHDSDWSIREASVRALCERFGGDADLRRLLVTLASSDEDRNFRRLAGQALSWLPGADPEHLPDIAD